MWKQIIKYVSNAFSVKKSSANDNIYRKCVAEASTSRTVRKDSSVPIIRERAICISSVAGKFPRNKRNSRNAYVQTCGFSARN